MAKKKDVCFNCGLPATKTPGKVPLCPKCLALSKGKERGVVRASR